MILRYKAFVKFTGKPNEPDFSWLNREADLEETRFLCRQHHICADLHSLANGDFVGSVLESGDVYSNLSHPLYRL